MASEAAVKNDIE